MPHNSYRFDPQRPHNKHDGELHFTEVYVRMRCQQRDNRKFLCNCLKIIISLSQGAGAIQKVASHVIPIRPLGTLADAQQRHTGTQAVLPHSQALEVDLRRLLVRIQDGTCTL